MVKTTLYLPPELREELRETARRTRRPQAELIREALRAYLKQQGRPLPRSIGIADNPDVSGADAEEWLEAHWRPM